MKLIFNMLNSGKELHEIAEVVGDLDLIDQCYKKWKMWKSEVVSRNSEIWRFRFEAEANKLAFYGLAWLILHRDTGSPKCLEYVDKVEATLRYSELQRRLPSEVLRRSVDQFIENVTREFQRDIEEGRRKLEKLLSYYYLSSQ